LTVTVRAAAVVVLPAASRAMAVSVWLALLKVVVSQVIEYGLVVSSAPTFAPSTLNCTPATPTLSDAVAETATAALTVAPAPGALIDTAGGVRSGGWFWTVTVTAVDGVVFPAASRATAVRAWLPFVLAVVLQLTE